uniref:TetR/AcrR family transcriptional regulator n=1 Tax=Sphingomonas populi TaxID=2484750 RepID=UPI0013EE3F5E|nr:TetR/AcrR family transcriptional regulator [Sphingomonas populi]
MAKPMTRNDEQPTEHTSRDKIKAIASDLVTMRGYHAVTFREIAEAIKTTRANLHYHFGTKDKLIEEVLADYVSVTTEFYRSTFTAPQISLREKMRRVREFLKARYHRFNPEGLTSHPWSLAARLRSDWEALSPQMKETMREFTSENDISVRIGIGLAINSGELREDAPQEDVALLLLNNILYAANVTRDTQSFDRLTALWEATLDAVQGAYGAQDVDRFDKPPTKTRGKSATQKGSREKDAKP